MTEQVYPLQWPEGRGRTPAHKVTWSRFDVTPNKAQTHMYDEIYRMGGSDTVVSTNMRVKQDGGIYAKDMNSTPDDAGVAVYFNRKGDRVCFCCDSYVYIWENMRAIGKTIEAMRAIERWGSAEMLDRAFTGFTALPAPGKADSQLWWNVLGVDQNASIDEIKSAYRSRAKELHSDVLGGNDFAMTELNVAKDMALKGKSS